MLQAPITEDVQHIGGDQVAAMCPSEMFDHFLWPRIAACRDESHDGSRLVRGTLPKRKNPAGILPVLEL